MQQVVPVFYVLSETSVWCIMAEKDSITKLGSANYYAWSVQVQSILDSKDLWEAIEDGWTEEELEDLDEDDKKKNKKALAFLKKSVEDSHLEFIGHLKSAKEAWDTLKTNFCERDEVQQLMMMKQLVRMEKSANVSVTEYVNKVIAAHRELSVTGLIEFSDKTLALIALMGLPEEFKDCVRSLTRDPKLTIRSLLPILRAEESKIKMEKEDRRVKDELKGYMSRNNPRSVPNFVPKPRFACHACGKTSHLVRECPKVLDARARGTVICYTCGAEGHPSSKCDGNVNKQSTGSANNYGGPRNGNSFGGAYNHGGPRSGNNNYGASSSSNTQQANSGGSGNRNFKNREARVETEENTTQDAIQSVGKGQVRVKFKNFMNCVGEESDDSETEIGDPNRWSMDSGCNAHATPHRELLEDLRPASGKMSVAKKKQTCEVRGVGRVTMKLKDENGGYVIRLNEVYWVPDSSDNLISVRQLDKKGMKFSIDDGWLYGYDKNDGDEEVIRAKAVEDDLYAVYVDWYERSKPQDDDVSGVGKNVCELPSVNIAARRAVTRELWHQRFGHANNLPDCEIIPKGECNDCEVCLAGKGKRKPYPVRETKSSEKLELILSDVCFVEPKTKNGGTCFVTFTDDYSRFSEVEILKSKSEVFDAFVKFKNRVENFQKKRIQNFQSDNGTEYVNHKFNKLFRDCGILHRRSMVGAHQQMGISERLNQQLLNMGRCMLIQSGLPLYFWGEAINTACFIKNRCVSKAIDGQIPFELWFDKRLDKTELNRLKVFGCQVWMFVENVKSHKMEPRAVECVLLGYPMDKRGYKLWNLREEVCVYSRDVRFVENVFPLKVIVTREPKSSENDCVLREVEIDDSSSEESDASEPGGEDDDGEVPVMQPVLDIPQVVDQNVVNSNNVNPEPRRSQREKKKKECLCCRSFVCHSCNVSNDFDFSEPKTVSEALNSKYKNQWIKAMEEEIQSLSKNVTWKLVKKPDDCKPIGCKWVFTIKRDQCGNLEKFKARLVALGCSQIPGVNYSETFSPVVKRKVIRLMTALMVENDWDCHHIDVETAYLNSPIKEDLFMRQPEGFVDEKYPNHVCKLAKSMYGLRQAGRDWNEYLHQVLSNLGLKRAVSDKCLYIHSSVQLFVTVYVDDLGVWGESEAIKDFICKLSKILKIRDLGFPSNFLAVKFTKVDDGIFVNQERYIRDLLNEYGFQNYKTLRTPLPIPSKCNDQKFNLLEPCDVTKYRQAVGSFRYVSYISRPDISFSVCKLSQKNESPTDKDWKNVKHLFRYLSGTKDLSLCYRKTGKTIEVFVDASWAKDKEDGKSVTGFVIVLGGAAVIWKSVTQKRLSANNNESEIMSMVDVLFEIEWLCVFLKDVRQENCLSKPCVVRADNQGAIKISKGEEVSERNRHCVVESYILQEAVRDNLVNFVYVDTKENVADVLTKILSGDLTDKFSKSMGLM